MKFKEFLEEIKSERYICIFICVFLILVYNIYRNMLSCKKSIENMADLDDNQILNAVNKYYSSDDFARTITTVFQKIQANGLQIVGNIDLTGDVKADGEISNQNISLTSFSKKIDDKAKLVADRKAAVEAERQRQAAAAEAERQRQAAAVEAERQRQAAAAEAERQRQARIAAAIEAERQAEADRQRRAAMKWDGCERTGQACRCGNGNSGKCGTGTAKPGMYCNCR